MDPTKITEPGLYPGIPDARYHADPIVEPSLSNSIAKLLVKRSARHAWFKHPRLNTDKPEVEKYDPKKAVGSAAHRTLLGCGAQIVPINFDDFKKKEAQQQRDDAMAKGFTPVLADRMRDVKLMVEAARDQLATTELAGYFDAPGESELTMAWRMPVQGLGNVWCRGRLDRLPASVADGGHVVVADLKTTGGSAHWDDWEGTAYDMAYDVQSAFYPLGLRTLIPSIRSVAFKFAVLEQDPPYGLTVCEFPGVAKEEARQDVAMALGIWAACMASGTWPYYAPETVTLDKAPWRSLRGEARRLALLRVMAQWQGIGAEVKPAVLGGW